MAISRHPMTGVPLNDIVVRRKALDEDDAVTAHIMRRQGSSFTEIVHRLGTNANRVGEVLRGDAFPQAAEKARNLLKDDLFSTH
ncbi:MULTISPECIES: hypothetical protein [Salipiger]|uniref:hypothetical protein n=1 Tax=Salipiger TaxID=263377 RepID=UPI0035183387